VQVLRRKFDRNSDIISEYITAMQIEINLSKGYKILTVEILTKLSQFHKDKSFAKMKREDIIAYINSLRKPDAQDPMHKWIGTYNLYLMCIKRFFKWVYTPALEPKQRPKPQIIQNIPSLKRKEISIYKPSDLWTLEDDLLFLKWCPNKRDRCYHAISRDLSARPHEILGLKLKDIVFKSVGSKQYAEVIVNGKTGARHLPLIDSLPYIKEWSDQHPQRNNPEAYFICSHDRKAFAKQMSLKGLQYIYKQYSKKYFPRLLNDPQYLRKISERLKTCLRNPGTYIFEDIAV
jgi:integrase